MLIDQLPPITKDTFWDAPIKVGLATALICLLAPIEFSITGDIPVTCQSLMVILPAMILGANLGGIAVLLYLVAGLIGLPVFAEGSSGLDKLWGPTGGFLISFPVAAWLAGKMAAGRWGRKWVNILLTILSAHVLILLIGFGWLGFMRGFENIVEKVYPLLPGLYIKVGVGTIIIALANSIMARIARSGMPD
jgi:biotin transport system substrate-specific component